MTKSRPIFGILNNCFKIRHGWLVSSLPRSGTSETWQVTQVPERVNLSAYMIHASSLIQMVLQTGSLLWWSAAAASRLCSHNSHSFIAFPTSVLSYSHLLVFELAKHSAVSTIILLFPQVPTWFSPSVHSGFCSNDVFSHHLFHDLSLLHPSLEHQMALLIYFSYL